MHHNATTDRDSIYKRFCLDTYRDVCLLRDIGLETSRAEYWPCSARLRSVRSNYGYSYSARLVTSIEIDLFEGAGEVLDKDWMLSTASDLRVVQAFRRILAFSLIRPLVQDAFAVHLLVLYIRHIHPVL